MVLANRCHRQNMKTSIINGSEVSRLSVAIQERLPGLLSAFEVVVWMTDGWPLYESRLKGKLHVISKRYTQRIERGTVAKLAMRQPFVLFKGLTFQKLCLPGAFRPGDSP
mgnify:CR=1 FL=1